MFVLAHLEKYIVEHPADFKKTGKGILARVRKIAGTEVNKPINSGGLSRLIGKSHAEQLFHLMGTDMGYLKISVEACEAAVK